MIITKNFLRRLVAEEIQNLNTVNNRSLNKNNNKLLEHRSKIFHSKLNNLFESRMKNKIANLYETYEILKEWSSFLISKQSLLSDDGQVDISKLKKLENDMKDMFDMILDEYTSYTVQIADMLHEDYGGPNDANYVLRRSDMFKNSLQNSIQKHLATFVNDDHYEVDSGYKTDYKKMIYNIGMYSIYMFFAEIIDTNFQNFKKKMDAVSEEDIMSGKARDEIRFEYWSTQFKPKFEKLFKDTNHKQEIMKYINNESNKLKNDELAMKSIKANDITLISGRMATKLIKDIKIVFDYVMTDLYSLFNKRN